MLDSRAAATVEFGLHLTAILSAAMASSTSPGSAYLTPRTSGESAYLTRADSTSAAWAVVRMMKRAGGDGGAGALAISDSPFRATTSQASSEPLGSCRSGVQWVSMIAEMWASSLP